METLDCGYNKLIADGLNALFGTLHKNVGTKTIYIGNNSGTSAADQSIVTAKNWMVNTTTPP